MEILSVAVLFLMFFGGYYFFGLNLTEKQRDNVARNLPPDYDSGSGIPVDENDNPIEKKTDSIDRSELLKYIISVLSEQQDKSLPVLYKNQTYRLEFDDFGIVWITDGANEKVVKFENVSNEELLSINNYFKKNKKWLKKRAKKRWRKY